jgi:hypothetical protein
MLVSPSETISLIAEGGYCMGVGVNIGVEAGVWMVGSVAVERAVGVGEAGYALGDDVGVGSGEALIDDVGARLAVAGIGVADVLFGVGKIGAPAWHADKNQAAETSTAKKRFGHTV